MARFTLPRDIYHGRGSLEALSHLKGKKARICVGGGSRKRFGFLAKAEEYLSRLDSKSNYSKVSNPIRLSKLLGAVLKPG